MVGADYAGYDGWEKEMIKVTSAHQTPYYDQTQLIWLEKGELIKDLQCLLVAQKENLEPYATAQIKICRLFGHFICLPLYWPSSYSATPSSWAFPPVPVGFIYHFRQLIVWWCDRAQVADWIPSLDPKDGNLLDDQEVESEEESSTGDSSGWILVYATVNWSNTL